MKKQLAIWNYINWNSTTIPATYNGGTVQVERFNEKDLTYNIKVNGQTRVVAKDTVTFLEQSKMSDGDYMPNIVKKLETTGTVNYKDNWRKWTRNGKYLEKDGNNNFKYTKKDFLNEVVNLLYDAKQYAKSNNNNNKLAPTIYLKDGEKVRVTSKDNDHVKIGPLYIRNNSNQVSRIEIKRGNTTYTISHLEDKSGNRKALQEIKNEAFYIVLDKKQNITKGKGDTTITLHHSSDMKLDKVNLYIGYHITVQDVLIADGKPERRKRF